MPALEHAKTTTRLIVAWIVALTVGLSVIPAAVADNEQQAALEFAAGLRQRRLFQLAETFCRRELSSRDATPRFRAEMTMELIRSLAERALHLPPESRMPVWRGATQVAAEFIARERRNPRLVLVMAQDALTSLANGELARQEAEISGDRRQLEVAKQHLRTAASRFTALDDELKRIIPLAGNAPPGEEPLTADELLSLQNNVRYQLGRTYRNQAMCYPEASEDRVNSLTRSISQFQKPLTQLAADDQLRAQVQIELAVSYRLLGDLGKAAQSLTTLDKDKLDPVHELKARAEWIRLELSAGRVDQARQRLLERREIGGLTSAELDLAHLETILALLRKADRERNESEMKVWQQRAANAVALIEQSHGAYWGRRASALLVRAAGAGTGSGNLEILRRTATEFYLKGELTAAITAYEKAARFASSAGQRKDAFELFCAAAQVELKRDKMPEFVKRLRSACRQFKELPSVPATHLTACIAAYRMNTKPGVNASLYDELLREHIAFWPKSTTAGEAHVRLGLMLQKNSKFAEAMKHYWQVGLDYERLDAVLQANDQCLRRHLATLSSSMSELNSAVDAALTHYDRIVMGDEQRLPERWSDAARSAVLFASRLRLKYRAAQLSQATQVLNAALSGQPQPPAAWNHAARALYVTLLARQGRAEQASQVLKQMGNVPAPKLLEVLIGLSQLQDPGGAANSQSIGRLQFALAERLIANKDQLQPASLARVYDVRARALADMGRRGEAITEYKRLVGVYPRDLAIQIGYAETLMNDSSPESRRLAADRWRLIKRVTRRGSESWFRANYSLALTYFRLGEKQRAAQIIELLQATTDISRSKYREQLEKLLTDSRR